MTASLIRLAVVGLVVAVTLGGYLLGYRAVAKASARSAELSSLIDARTAAQNRAVALRATLDQLASDEAEIRKYFVSTDSVVAFLGELQARGKEVGADVKVVSVSTGATPGGRPSLNVALTISGSFASVMNAVGRVEYVPYALSVKALSVVSGGTNTPESETKNWTANMTVSVGSMQASTTTPASAPTKPPLTGTTTKQKTDSLQGKAQPL